jgi:hypothetical protein
MQLTGVTNLERTNTSPRYSAKMNELGYQITVTTMMMMMMMVTAAKTSSMEQRSC